MKKTFILIASAALALMAGSCASKSAATKLKAIASEKDSLSFAMGQYYGDMLQKSLENFPAEVDRQVLLNGLTAVVMKRPTHFSVEEATNYVEKAYKAGLDRKKEENLKAGEAFVADYAKKGGDEVKHTKSGIYYKVLREGNSSMRPTVQDTVVVHYEGRNIKGEVFDSSYERGKPITFSLLDVIPGWTEGVCLMNKGAKYQLVIPAKLAYGERAMSDKLPANSTLVFDIELLDIKPYVEKEAPKAEEPKAQVKDEAAQKDANKKAVKIVKNNRKRSRK